MATAAATDLRLRYMPMTEEMTDRQFCESQQWEGILISDLITEDQEAAGTDGDSRSLCGNA